jgi:hypothetical protein
MEPDKRKMRIFPTGVVDWKELLANVLTEV